MRESLDRFPSLINTILKQRIYQMVLHRPIECSALSRISASFGPSSVRVNGETVYSGRREAGVVKTSIRTWLDLLL